MPHALSMPAPGFQAVILCGPGSSFPTFTSNPDEYPKALIPIANRPMVWYPIDFCYRMGITDITLIAPPSSASAITAALNTIPHLTSLPLPKPNLLAPEDLDQTTGTAEIFRLPEVRDAIKTDFVVLPCDLVCEMGGEALLETWMIKEAGLGGPKTAGIEPQGSLFPIGGEEHGRRGGLGVWYQTKGQNPVKGEETDFISLSPLPQGPVQAPAESLLPHTSKLIYSMPTDTLNDVTEEKKSLPIRHAMIKANPRLRMLSSFRDAHLYILPLWVLDLINENEHMDNLSEDVIGWWAKATWQEGLGEKLGLDKILNDSKTAQGGDEEEDVDVTDLSTTHTSSIQDSSVSQGTSDSDSAESSKKQTNTSKLVVPPVLAYVHPSKPDSPLIRRVDTAPLLLNVSLQLAKLDSVENLGRQAASPLAHQAKVAHPAGVAAKCTVTRQDCLLAENVTVEERCAVKECVVGANCHIKQGAKLTRCVLMDGVIVGSGCKLTGCILGRRSEIGEDSVLLDCETQDHMLVEAGTEAKNEKFMSSQGLEASEQEFEDAFADDDDTMDAVETASFDG